MNQTKYSNCKYFLRNLHIWKRVRNLILDNNEVKYNKATGFDYYSLHFHDYSDFRAVDNGNYISLWETCSLTDAGQTCQT